MLERCIGGVVRRPRLVIGVAAALVMLSGIVGAGVADSLVAGGFDNPNSEAVRTEKLLVDRFNVADPDLVLLVQVKGDATVDDPDVAAAGRALTTRLEAEPGVDQVESYWTLDSSPPFKSEDSSRALVLAHLTGTENEVSKRVERITKAYSGTFNGLSVGVGGPAAVYAQFGTTIEKDLLRAESIAIPITLIVLLFVFGSLVAASLPLVIGGLAVLGSFAVLQVITTFTDVSIFALNLATGLGLGLAIDYSLLVVSRYREELAEGYSVEDAVLRTVLTAGRTVIFSGITVAVSLMALLIFPTVFLRSFAYAGVAIAVLAVLGAIVVLPAMLVLIGRRVDSLMLWRRSAQISDQGAWRKVASAVMRRPVIAGGSVVVLLLVAGLPFLHVQLGIPDDRVLSKSASTRQVSDELRRYFSARELAGLTVVAPNTGGGEDLPSDIDRYAARTSKLDGVARVDAATGSYIKGSLILSPTRALHGRFSSTTHPSSTWLSVIPDVEPMSPAGEALANRLRSSDAPWPIQVGGPSAQLVDNQSALLERLPIALGLISVTTFLLLFMMFGSVVVPLKALVLNALSLCAMFGAMVFVFQDGHFAELLGFTATGTIENLTPIMMFCVAFGLSMDYEVFLLSRIKEEYDRTGDNAHSVAVGLQRTGRIVTAAAVLLSIVFGSFISSSVAGVKLLGLGLTLAILVDATLVRGVLVPAFMRLAGTANWWAPRPLRAFHNRFGISEASHGGLPGDRDR